MRTLAVLAMAYGITVGRGELFICSVSVLLAMRHYVNEMDQ